jgi:hypothetical protein
LRVRDPKGHAIGPWTEIFGGDVTAILLVSALPRYRVSSQKTLTRLCSSAKCGSANDRYTITMNKMASLSTLVLHRGRCDTAAIGRWLTQWIAQFYDHSAGAVAQHSKTALSPVGRGAFHLAGLADASLPNNEASPWQ